MTDASSDNQEASKETDAEYTWYEKTVEYKFVLEAKELWGIDFLAPLDGSAERIGDALLEKGTKSFIVEFKKDLKSMSSEFKNTMVEKKDIYLPVKNSPQRVCIFLMPTTW